MITPTTQNLIRELAEKFRLSIYSGNDNIVIHRVRDGLTNALTSLATTLEERIEGLEKENALIREQWAFSGESIFHQTQVSSLDNEKAELKEQMVGLRREIQHQKNRVDAYNSQVEMTREALIGAKKDLDDWFNLAHPISVLIEQAQIKLEQALSQQPSADCY